MLKTIIASFILAFSNIRSHFFHTLLSVLGIVIGVASLVAILSLIDGMEKFAQDQITRTTSLKMITVIPEPNRLSNGVRIRKDSVTFLNYEDFRSLEAHLTKPAKAFMYNRQAREIRLERDTVRAGAQTTAVVGLDTMGHMLEGRGFSEAEFLDRKHVCILNNTLATRLQGNDDLEKLLGKSAHVGDRILRVVGIIDLPQAQGPELFFPYTLLSDAEVYANVPTCIVEAERVEDVFHLKEEITAFIGDRFSGKHDFRINTNEFRVEQAAKGFFLFRVIMGLIVGVSVLVGGIGVMNVLLISVTERTVEIGVRKAVGANRRHIILQFLSESITISFIGSLAGLVLGVLGTMAIVPIVRSLTEIPFQVAYTINTLMVVSILALIVGVGFGTYPAMRAAKLDPVEAIRRE